MASAGPRSQGWCARSGGTEEEEEEQAGPCGTFALWAALRGAWFMGVGPGIPGETRRVEAVTIVGLGGGS